MGLLTRLTGQRPTPNSTTDDVYLLHGLMLMAGADGVIEDAEWNTLRQYWFTLPEFRGKSFEQLMQQAQKLLNQFSSLQESLSALANIENDAIRRKLFVLATDLAMSTGDVDANEDRMLESMQRILNISDDLARQVVQVLAMKYSAAA